MKPTRAITLVATALSAAVAAYLYSIYSLNHGHALWVSGTNIMFTLPVIALILLALAWPIYRYRQSLIGLAKKNDAATKAGEPISVSQVNASKAKRVDPFYAVRIVLLAKATALVSALFIGWHLGVILIQLGAPIVSSALWPNVITLIGSIVALAIALWIEWICRIPESPDEAPAVGLAKTSGIDAALPKQARVNRGVTHE